MNLSYICVGKCKAGRELRGEIGQRTSIQARFRVVIEKRKRLLVRRRGGFYSRGWGK